MKISLQMQFIGWLVLQRIFLEFFSCSMIFQHQIALFSVGEFAFDNVNEMRLWEK